MPKSKKMAEPTPDGMDIQTIPIDQIKPSEYNPRVALKPGDPEWESLAKSLDEFGTVEPLVWNRQTGNLVGGHQRFAILTQRGAKTVTVSVVDLPLAKEKALNLALNKIEGKWDNPKVLNVLSDLMSEGIDLTTTGWQPEEMAELASAMDTQLFTPVTPVLEAREKVTQEHVHRAARGEKERFTKETEVLDMTCPECGYVFGIGGDMADVAAQTPGLKTKRSNNVAEEPGEY